MTSPGHKIGLILKLIYLRQYGYLFGIFNFRYNFRLKKMFVGLKMVAILKILKY